jgi:hypothetical protein
MPRWTSRQRSAWARRTKCVVVALHLAGESSLPPWLGPQGGIASSGVHSRSAMPSSRGQSCESRLSADMPGPHDALSPPITFFRSSGGRSVLLKRGSQPYWSVIVVLPYR